MGAGAATMYLSDTRVHELEDVLMKARSKSIFILIDYLLEYPMYSIYVYLDFLTIMNG